MSKSILKEEESDLKSLDKTIWMKLIRILLVDKKIVVQSIAIILFMSCIDIFLPYLNKFAIDYYITSQNGYNYIGYFIIVYLTCIILQSINVYLSFKRMAILESNFGKRLRKMAFHKLQNLSFSYYDRTANGWLVARLTGDVNRLAEILAWGIFDFGWGIFLMTGILITMFVINAKMACVLLVLMPFVFIVSRYFQKKILLAQRKSRTINSKITASFAEGINGAKTTKTLHLERRNANDFFETSSEMKSYSLRAAKINALFQPMIYLFSAIVIAALLQIGGIDLQNNTITFGTLALFINYAQMFFDPLKMIARLLAEFQMAQANAERILGLLEEEVEIVDTDDVIEQYGTLMQPKKHNYVSIMGNIEFKNIDFYYKKDEIILENFNFKAKAGEMIALVGHTGSGKSTLVNLLSRFYEPKSGEILIDDIDYRKRSLGWLHSQLGYVLQTPTLFSGTIKENIAYGMKNASDEKIMEVAKLVNAHGFIMELQKGYETSIGEGGDLLSTGEKQLISFARALLCDPKIIILDEATSSIDTQKEQLIQEAMQVLLQNRTSFVVAHRLSTIEKADIILVMDHGKIVEQGSHKHLLSLKGSYYDLYQKQKMLDAQKKILHSHNN